MRKLLIWGAGDQGTVTLDCALAMGIYSQIDFLTIKERGYREIPGYRIFKEEEENLGAFLESYDEAVAAVGSNRLREEKTASLAAAGIPLASIIHPTAFISPSAGISGGCTVLPNAVIHTNASVGTGCIINTGAVIEHDCVLEDFVNVCPRAAMAGHVHIGRKAFLGIGSTVIDGIHIGKTAVVGAGAVVIRNVPDGAAVAGVPAKPIKLTLK